MGHFKNLGFSTNGNAKLWIRKMLLFNKCDSDQAVSRANVFGKSVGISCSKQLPTGNWEESQEGSQSILGQSPLQNGDPQWENGYPKGPPLAVPKHSCGAVS